MPVELFYRAVPEHGFKYGFGFQNPRPFLGITVNMSYKEEQLIKVRNSLKEEEKEILKLKNQKKKLKQKCAEDKIDFEDYEEQINEIRKIFFSLKEKYQHFSKGYYRESNSRFHELYFPFINSYYQNFISNRVNYFALSRIFQDNAIIFDDDNVQRLEYYERIISKIREF